MPMEMMLKSKILWETLIAKGYDSDEVETGRVTIGEDPRILLEKLAGDIPVARNIDKDKAEVTILKTGEEAQGEDSTIRQLTAKKLGNFGREDPRGHTKTDYASKEKSDFHEGSRTPRTRSRVRGMVEISKRQ